MENEQQAKQNTLLTTRL